ncbi:MAG: hypothetical protein PVF54_01630 [Anaerolineae bacterium]|jgi:hypothetical protein
MRNRLIVVLVGLFVVLSLLWGPVGLGRFAALSGDSFVAEPPQLLAVAPCGWDWGGSGS